MALAWIGATIAFGSVVRKANRSFVVSPSLTLRTDVQRVQMPAKKASGRLSSSANHTGGREPSGKTSFSAKLVNGTTQRLSTPSHRRQCGEATLRTFVTPGSELRPFEGEDRRRHAPARHRQLALAILRVADDRRGVVGKDAGDRRQVAGRVAHGAGEVADRLRAFGDGVEVAHGSSISFEIRSLIKEVRPHRVAEITYFAWTADGLLRHMVFVGLRSNKSATEVGRKAHRATFVRD